MNHYKPTEFEAGVAALMARAVPSPLPARTMIEQSERDRRRIAKLMRGLS